jgi:type II secretory pathway component PulJ
LLKEEKNRYMSKIEELEEEIEQLYRDNYRMKEMEKTQHQPQETFNVTTLNEKNTANSIVYEPYIIKTRTNDLNKINEKNLHKQQARITFKEEPRVQPVEYYDMLGPKLEKEKPLTAQDFFNKKPTNKGLYG